MSFTNSIFNETSQRCILFSMLLSNNFEFVYFSVTRYSRQTFWSESLGPSPNIISSLTPPNFLYTLGKDLTPATSWLDSLDASPKGTTSCCHLIVSDGQTTNAHETTEEKLHIFWGIQNEY